jgi:hypothetical protein
VGLIDLFDLIKKNNRAGGRVVIRDLRTESRIGSEALGLLINMRFTTLITSIVCKWPT